jgi:hypothetical protein
MQPTDVVAQFDGVADIVAAVGPPLAMLLGLLLLQLACVAAMAAPGVWITVTVVRATGWRGVAFMGLLWSVSWRIAAGS